LPKMKTMKLKKLWFWVLPFLKNKFTLAFIVFVGWIVFFDQNNLFDRVQNLNQMHQLERDKVYYLEKIRQDSIKLIELKTDKENLEKFAREQYLMKKKNEDIFIIAD
jgi:cell division protein DivIC